MDFNGANPMKSEATHGITITVIPHPNGKGGNRDDKRPVCGYFSYMGCLLVMLAAFITAGGATAAVVLLAEADNGDGSESAGAQAETLRDASELSTNMCKCIIC